MKLIGLNLLDEHCKKHTDCRSWIENWIADVKNAKWTSLNDLKTQYPYASILPGNLIIFNIKGNSYRLLTQVAVNTKVVLVKWVGTHAEYTHKKF